MKMDRICPLSQRKNKTDIKCPCNYSRTGYNTYTFKGRDNEI